MRRLTMVLVGLALVASMAGCEQPDVALDSGNSAGGGAGNTAQQLPTQNPYLRGKIQSIVWTQPVATDCVSEGDLDPDGTVSSDDPPVCNPNPDTRGSIHVKGEAGTGESEIVASIAKSIPIVRRDGDGNIEPAAFEDLAEGDTVTLWITGAVMESFPVQGAASYVVIEQGS